MVVIKHGILLSIDTCLICTDVPETVEFLDDMDHGFSSDTENSCKHQKEKDVAVAAQCVNPSLKVCEAIMIEWPFEGFRDTFLTLTPIIHVQFAPFAIVI